MRIGAYDVLGELGRGGMGVVYRVRTPDGREAALKLLLGTLPATVTRFERERRLLASLGEEQGFVGLLDAGSTPKGAWLLMPLVPGGTLRQRLERGPLGVEETLALGMELARALGRAHERGIVHRDVKPENVLFTAAGRPLLADLGLAKHFDRLARGASQSVSLSREGAFKGTAGYVAPEQIEDAKRAGPPADVFALGAVLHECLSGRPAFLGESALELLAKVSSGDVAPIGRGDVPLWLERTLARALAKHPGDRFADGTRLALALAVRGRPVRAPRKLLVPLVLGAALGALVVAGFSFLPGRTRARIETADEDYTPADRSADLAVRAERLIQARDYDGAIAAAEEAIRLDPKNARAWMRRGSARDWKHDADGGIADLTRAIELEPGLADAWEARGTARGDKLDFDGAIADATRAIELSPRSATAWGNRGSARADKGDARGAIEDETRALEIDPKNVAIYVNRAIAKGKLDDLDGDIQDCDRAIAVDPRFARAWDTRGRARGRKKDWAGMIEDETRAIELDPRSADAWAHRGVARGHAGDPAAEIVDENRALELAPDRPVTLANRGAARYATGDYPGAIKDLERSLELDPASPDAHLIQNTLDAARKQSR